MKVYIVDEGSYSDTQTIAVMSTLELAKDAVRAHLEMRRLKAIERWDYTEEEAQRRWPYKDDFNYRDADANAFESWSYVPDSDYNIYAVEVDQMPAPLEDWR